MRAKRLPGQVTRPAPPRYHRVHLHEVDTTTGWVKCAWCPTLIPASSTNDLCRSCRDRRG